jgi:hypothetical protein
MIAFARGDDGALESFLDDVRTDRMWFYRASAALLVQGQREALLTLLEWDLDPYDRLVPLAWSADHAVMRRDPRFIEYLRRLGVTELWREIGPPPDCRADGDTWRCGLTGKAAD